MFLKQLRATHCIRSFFQRVEKHLISDKKNFETNLTSIRTFVLIFNELLRGWSPPTCKKSKYLIVESMIDIIHIYVPLGNISKKTHFLSNICLYMEEDGSLDPALRIRV